MSELMTPTSTRLDASTFPMQGVRLIEASAGTGKTYTIANLYLRLLLGDGEGVRSEPMTVEQILVVTFTEAATAELRTRIRERIVEARLAFSREKTADPFLEGLLANCARGIWSSCSNATQAARLLLHAERQMDTAAIYTIHGFCQRMLVQNAFESGARFRSTLLQDERPIRQQVMEDYWRRNFYGLPSNLTKAIYDEAWSSPKALLKDVEKHLSGQELAFSLRDNVDDITSWFMALSEQTDELKRAWQCIDLSDLNDEIAQAGLNGNKFRKTSIDKWLTGIDEWRSSPFGERGLCEGVTKFAQNNVSSAVKKNGAPFEKPIFQQTQAYCDLSAQSPFKPTLLMDAIQKGRVGLIEAKRRGAWLSFDDLLGNLAQALDSDHGEALAARIRQLYPVAMIDEFQDTDPLQYRIFNGVYENNPDCGLLMIGDPKQAIYAFRGADIFTYIHARQGVQDHYTLDTNWRSSADMVSSVNRLFSQHDAPFYYQNDIPFQPVSAKPNAENMGWQLNGEPQSAMTLWLPNRSDSDPEPIKAKRYKRLMAEGTASEIQRILTLSGQGKADIFSGDKTTPIAAGDIAILVRTGKEGRLMRETLNAQGIASVYLSNRDSVFSQQEANDVLLLLQAVFSPEDERRVRSALACRLMGQSALQIDELNRDEWRWETVIQQFKDYREWWQKKGVMPMIRHWMGQWQIAERLLLEMDGERRLTDLLHIAELLQTASQTLDSDHALLRLLADNMAEPNGNVNEQQLRLESERRLVKIVTIHKSKGLEYPIVFVPFVSDFIAQKSEAVICYHDEHSLKLTAEVSDQKPEKDAAKILADKERLAEDLRLLYVAVTRAKVGCYLGLAALTSSTRAITNTTKINAYQSAMGYLLHQDKNHLTKDLMEAVTAWHQAQPSMTVSEPPLLPTLPYKAEAIELTSLKASVFSGHIDRQWWTTSYSSLVKQGNQAGEWESTAGFDVDSAVADGTESSTSLVTEKTVFSFPKGARPGTFLHSIFEEIEFTADVYGERNTAILRGLLSQSGYDEEWLPILQSWVQTILQRPLDGQTLRLKDKLPHQRMAEMEFVLPINALSAIAVNDVLKKHDAISEKAGDLGFRTVSGLLKGFIDLIFEHEGRYYILDWKSNHLGSELTDYTPSALVQAMQAHRYDWQYQIYALALHRFLTARVKDYDYDAHFGGVYYLFLRGITESGDQGIFFNRPSLAFLTDLECVMAGESANV